MAAGLRMLKFQWTASPVAFVVSQIGNILRQAFQRLLVIATGITIDGLVRAPDSGPGAFTLGIILIAVVLFIDPVTKQLSEIAVQKLKTNTTTLSNVSLAELALADPTLHAISEPQRSAKWKRLNTKLNDWMWLYWSDANLDNLATRFGALLSFAIVATWNIWIALLLSLGHIISSRVAGSWNDLVFQEFDAAPGSDLYRAEFLRKKLMNAENAKEVRLFGWTPWFLADFRRLWENSLANIWPSRKQMSKRALASGAIQILTHSVAVAVLILNIRDGIVSAGQVLTIFGTLASLGGLGYLGFPQTVAKSNAEIVTDLVSERTEAGLDPVARVRDLKTEAGISRRSVTATKPVNVTIRNLTFGYPGRAPIFHNLNLDIPAGQSVAIVGVNGAGKSTLIKLLCGLYLPTSGSISLNGKAPLDARGDIAVVFQEFEHYHRTLAENIAVGAFGAEVPQEVLDRVLEQARGTGLLTEERGWDTMLSAEYDGGTDLSGGQWQRVALARAFTSLASGAGLLILDEPTSALDVRAEKELFDDFLSVTKGATTILVTHRLAAVRRAERIIVIEDGRVVADASHEEHMRNGGLYADMFRLQASRYVDAEEAQ